MNPTTNGIVAALIILPASGEPAAVLNRDGTGGRYPLYICSHTGKPYYYRNKGRGAIRVYVEPGESANWLEVPDPLTGKYAVAA